jgi:GntR family transcriptional regulator
LRESKTNQVADAILADIESGKLTHGDRVYSERAIIKRFGVSLGTAQRALAHLELRGVVSRRQGRGSFVTGVVTAATDANYLRFRDEDGAALALEMEILSMRSLAVPRELREFFGIDVPSCMRICRLVDVGHRFKLMSDFFIGADVFERLVANADFQREGNLRKLLANALLLPTISVEQGIRFEPLAGRVTRQLRLDQGAPGLVMSLRAFTRGARPLYAQTVAGSLAPGVSLMVER